MILTIVSVVLTALWSIIYLTTIYQQDVVYLGYGPRFSVSEDGVKTNNYIDQDINGYITVECLWALI